MTRRVVPVPAGVALGLAVALAGCSGGSSEDAAPAAVDAGPSDIYVAIGSDQTLGTGLERPLIHAWPRLFYRAKLGRSAVFVNAATEGSTVAEALEEQIPLALELEPALVTVWLNMDDLTAGVPVDTYERQLTELVRALRRDGRTQVLVANTPPGPLSVTVPDSLVIDLDRAPSGVDGFALDENPAAPDLTDHEIARRLAAYNDAIARVAVEEGAKLVDLYAAANEDRPPGAPPDNGLDLTPEGHARVADVFAEAL